MPTLCFKCPTTGMEIPTGLALDDLTLQSCGSLAVEVGCACGERHTFRMDEATRQEPQGLPPFQNPFVPEAAE